MRASTSSATAVNPAAAVSASRARTSTVAPVVAQWFEDGSGHVFRLVRELAPHWNVRHGAAGVNRDGKDVGARGAGDRYREVDGTAVGGASAVAGEDGIGHRRRPRPVKRAHGVMATLATPSRWLANRS